MRVLKICTAFFYLICPLLLIAQQVQAVDLSKALRVGDDFIPPASVQLMRGYENTIDWKSLEDKVVLLDFFATSCGTCIQTMPHLQELQQEYSDVFKVIVVAMQDRASLEDFFSKNQYLKKHQVNLPVIYGDSYLKGLFPYKSVPHSVLLYKGKVQAITTAGFITRDNVLKLYKEEKIALPLKDDYGKGNLLTGINGSQNDLKAGALFAGYQDGVDYQPWKFEWDSLTGMYKSSVYNASVYGALLSLATRAKIKESYVPRMDRVLWKVKDSTKYNSFTQPSDVWLVDNAVSYERYDRKERPDSIQARIIMEDFDHLYGVKAYEGTKVTSCLVLKKCPIVSYEGKDLEQKMVYAGSTVLSVFLDYVGKFPPVVDEVKIDDKIQLGNYETLDDLNEQLAAYGIKGVIEEREIKVLVIEEVD